MANGQRILDGLADVLAYLRGEPNAVALRTVMVARPWLRPMPPAAPKAPKAAGVAQPMEPQSVWLWKLAPAGMRAKAGPIDTVPSRDRDVFQR